MTTRDPTQQARRLYRSKDDKMIAGIAGGLARYLGVDPVLTRLAFVALVLAAGTGVIFYLIGWLIIPLEGSERHAAGTSEVTPAPASGNGGPLARVITGSILVVIGALLLLDRVIPDLSKFFWPVALISLGIGLFTFGARR